MPRVPTVDAPSVGQEPIPGARLSAQATPDAFGATVGAGLSDIGRVRSQVIEQQGQVAVQDAGVQRQQWEADNLYGPNGALNKKGKDALGARDQALNDFDQTAGKIQAGLATPQQQYEFQRQTAAHRLLIQRTLDNHVAGQVDELDQTSTMATVANSKNAAIANAGDPKRVGAEILLQQATLKQFAQRRGLPAEWVDLHTQEAASDTHVGVIDRMLANEQDQQAKAYYQANGDQIVGSAKPQIERALEIGSTRAESQKQSDAIVLSAKDQVEALARADAISDPRLRDETKRRVMQHYVELHGAQQASWEDAYNKGIQALTDPQNTKGVDGVPANLIAAMGPHQEAFDKFARWKASGREVVSDPTLVYQLKTMASGSQDDQNAFVKTFLPGLYDKLAPADRNELSNLQMEVRKTLNKGTKSADLSSLSSATEVFKEALPAIGLNPTKEASLFDPKAVALRQAFDKAVIDEETTSGKKLNADQMRKVASKLVANVAYQGTGFWGQTTTLKRPLYQAPGFDQFAFGIEHVPAADLSAIQASAANSGKKLTDDQIVDIYNQNAARKAAGWKPPVIDKNTGKPVTGGDDGEGFGIPIGNESQEPDAPMSDSAPLIGNE